MPALRKVVRNGYTAAATLSLYCRIHPLFCAVLAVPALWVRHAEDGSLSCIADNSCPSRLYGSRPSLHADKTALKTQDVWQFFSPATTFTG